MSRGLFFGAGLALGVLIGMAVGRALYVVDVVRAVTARPILSEEAVA